MLQFGECGGSCVNHCHNTVHEDFALLMRIQLLMGERTVVRNILNPTVFATPEILPEGDPRQRPDLIVPKAPYLQFVGEDLRT
jgi:hypothetical protein